MRIGYACITVGVRGAKQSACMIKNANPDNLISLILSNLKVLDKILDYNILNGIKLFRISSEIIPFGSHPINTIKWWEIFHDHLLLLGHKAVANGIRLSMHPGQYTILNSPCKEVVERAIQDLRYHTRVLDAMGLGKEHKIVLHIGGIYGDKADALKRFVRQYHSLDENIRQRLVIENDDRQYNISDVLSIGESEGIPVVFDNLHHLVNPDSSRSDAEWISICGDTWKQCDGPPKLHYSQQYAGKRRGSHSATLNADDFSKFYNCLPRQDIDIMVEVKDKNLSAIKCLNVIAPPQIQLLEKEWERYKYLVLEHDPQVFGEIEQLLKDKSSYPVAEFYRLIDKAIISQVKLENAVNAALHVLGCFKDVSDKNTLLSFQKNIDKISISAIPLKRLLWKLAEEQQCLLDSLYFIELL